MERHLEIFKESLLLATRNVDDSYFNFIMAGKTEPRHLERVYCYELYSQIRNILPTDFPFVVQCEIDKSAHPLIDNQDKPDFLVHIPGKMNDESNLVIMEVKRENQALDEISKDFDKLKDFTDNHKYHLGIALIFGNISERKKRSIKEMYHEVCKEHFDKVKLYFHEGVGTSAYECVPPIA